MARQLPDEVYEFKQGEAQIAGEAQVHYPVTEVKIISTGIYQFLLGAEHPSKGYAEAGGLFAMNMVKRIFIEGLRLMNQKSFMIVGVLFVFKRRKKKIEFIQSILHSFTEIGMKIISPYVLKPNFMIGMSRQVGFISTEFLLNIGIKEDTALNFGRITAMMFELDNAYRFRLQDLFSETTKEKLIDNPYGEISRLLEISRERDHEAISAKFRYVKYIAFTLFLFPYFKHAFRSAIHHTKFEELQFDEIERYWVSMRTDYNFWGKTGDERAEYVKGMKIPIPMTMHQYWLYQQKQNRNPKKKLKIKSKK